MTLCLTRDTNHVGLATLGTRGVIEGVADVLVHSQTLASDGGLITREDGGPLVDLLLFLFFVSFFLVLTVLCTGCVTVVLRSTYKQQNECEHQWADKNGKGSTFSTASIAPVKDGFGL